MPEESRLLYVAGYGLGLVGTLATVAGLLLAGSMAAGVLALGVAFPLVLGLVGVSRSEAFDIGSTLAYRVGNWGGGILVAGVGLAMLGIGVVTLATVL